MTGRDHFMKARPAASRSVDHLNQTVQERLAFIEFRLWFLGDVSVRTFWFASALLRRLLHETLRRTGSLHHVILRLRGAGSSM